MAMPEMDAVKDAALKYDKPTLARLAQSGQLSPTLAVMAGMMRDRIVQSEMKPPSPPTVAEEVMQPMGQRMGLAAAAQAPQQTQPQGQGLDQVPVPQQMFERQGMANGGIVAFQAGGGARNPRLIGALENVLSQLQTRDPALNVDYVRRAVLSAPESQQRTLMQQLVERVGMDDQFKPAAASFTEALKTKEVDPNVMRAMQLSGGLTPDEMATPSPLDQAETGAQPGARPGVKDFTGSEVYAGLAQRAGNIYEGGVNPLTGAMDIAQSGMQSFRDTFGPKAKMGDEGIIEPSATDYLGQGVPEPIDPFSATQGRTAIRGGQTDTGAVDYSQETPSAEMLKQAAKDQAKKAEAPKVQAGPTKEAADKKEGKKTFNDYLTEVTSGIGTSTVGQDMRDEIAKDRKARKEDQQNAMWMSLVEAGLGIMGGESPYAFVNIGKGATNALKSYADRLREQKKLDREDRRILLDIEKAERAELRDNYKLASESYNKALDRMNATDRANISARASMYSADKSVEAASMLKPGQAITSRVKLAEAVDAQLVMDRQYQKLRKENPAAAEAFRKQIIDARANEIGLNQMPGLNLGAWGQLTTVPGAK